MNDKRRPIRCGIVVLLGLVTASAAAFAQQTARATSAAAPTAAAAEVDARTPQSLIETAANAMLRELNANRAVFRKDPQLVYALVDRILLPHFDVTYAARAVLGRHWRGATAEQRQRFIDAFYNSLLNNYGDALVDFTGDRLKVLPSSVDPAATTATVRTEVKRTNGQRVPVHYQLRKTEQGWKAWDVVIEGISYVKSFREDFGAEIDQKGLDAVIQRLEAQGAVPKR
ncbi:MAG: ABC transporter substrate-binding protein [Steroidobacteraceae bacterium]|nr:ABC transporter substrate-binding protein [Steroidobacteraceae bacterium]MDW8258013.1 ABC transporter substrate-binding protein [Gammaproteobacteria bacterium]